MASLKIPDPKIVLESIKQAFDVAKLVVIGDEQGRRDPIKDIFQKSGRSRIEQVKQELDKVRFGEDKVSYSLDDDDEKEQAPNYKMFRVSAKNIVADAVMAEIKERLSDSKFQHRTSFLSTKGIAGIVEKAFNELDVEKHANLKAYKEAFASADKNNVFEERLEKAKGQAKDEVKEAVAQAFAAPEINAAKSAMGKN